MNKDLKVGDLVTANLNRKGALTPLYQGSFPVKSIERENKVKLLVVETSAKRGELSYGLLSLDELPPAGGILIEPSIITIAASDVDERVIVEKEAYVAELARKTTVTVAPFSPYVVKESRRQGWELSERKTGRILEHFDTEGDALKARALLERASAR